MTLLLSWFTSSALALTPITLPAGRLCPPSYKPCIGLLDADFEIFPESELRVAQAAIAPEPLRWLEITLTTYVGEVELTVQGDALDPRFGLADPQRGTISWVVPVLDIANVNVEARNPSRRVVAEYEVVAEVLVTAP